MSLDADAADVEMAQVALDSRIAAERCVAILMQVEYYFSVVNISRDVFLRSIMDGRGYVPIDRLVQFPKLRKMDVGVNEASAILRMSTYLSVSRDGQRVRIKDATLRDIFPYMDVWAS
jgi:la-related protein 1